LIDKKCFEYKNNFINEKHKMTLKNIKLIIDNREKDLKGIFPDAEYKNLDLGDIQIKLISQITLNDKDDKDDKINEKEETEEFFTIIEYLKQLQLLAIQHFLKSIFLSLNFLLLNLKVHHFNSN
jgi:hypothetical protein